MSENINENTIELDANELEQVSGGKSAHQYVKTTGDVYVRSGPGLDYDKKGLLTNGTKVPFLGEARYDDRGVAWYKISYEGHTRWVSSKYSKIV